jgi:glutathione synthase/RimK-type ligase-like ATP-grasp enzyme
MGGAVVNKSKRNDLKSIARSMPFYQSIRRGYRAANQLIHPQKKYTFEEEHRLISQARPIIIHWPENIPKPRVGLVREQGNRLNDHMYWTKYERFLKSNQIPYIFVDIHHSTFQAQAEPCDVIIWRTLNDPAYQWEAETKIRILEKEMGKFCLPTEEELWFYEDKIRQYYLLRHHNLPIVSTFITYSQEEAMDYICRCVYPLVSKVSNGAGSMGVRLIKDYHQAKKICQNVFDFGQTTYCPYLKQKNYVYFQEFIKDAAYDLRVIVTGNSFLGYYRNTPKDDFRASGHGTELVEKKAIPREALMLAKQVKEALPPTRILAVDMLRNPQDGQYYIIETSIFIAVYTPVQLMVNNVPGRYILEDGDFRFEAGKFWLQELALVELFNEWIRRNHHQ